MADRDAIARRKHALLNDLRRAGQEALAGAMGAQAYDVGPALSQRELCARYGLSGRTVSLALQQLVEEGVLYTVPRVGTFLGRPVSAAAFTYLMLRPEPAPGSFYSLAQMGFESRIGQLGGSTLCLSGAEFVRQQASGFLPALAGVFLLDAVEAQLTPPLNIPAVRFGSPDASSDSAGSALPEGILCDRVDFDNEAGGVQATEHLLRQGHRHIAYLGLHGHSGPLRPFGWSLQRQEGWRRALQEHGIETEGLGFQPELTPHGHWDEQAAAGAEAAAGILARAEISAVVTANSFAARGLLHALRASGQPAARWPAILCFDTPEANVSVLSCVQQPWDEVGREAARLLWERNLGKLHGAPRLQLVPMRLLARLTCRQEWAHSDWARQHAVDSWSNDPSEMGGGQRLVPTTRTTVAA